MEDVPQQLLSYRTREGILNVKSESRGGGKGKEEKEEKERRVEKGKRRGEGGYEPDYQLFYAVCCLAQEHQPPSSTCKLQGYSFV